MRGYLAGIIFLLVLIAAPFVLKRALAPAPEEDPGFAGGTELIYTVEGDPAAVAGVLNARLDAYGARAEADVVDGRIRVRVAAREHEHLPAIRELVVQRGGLEFRITVEPTASEHYDEYWRRFRGQGAREVTPQELAEEDRLRYPLGLRWYPLREHAQNFAGRVPDMNEPFVLCALDEFNITDEALHDIRAERGRGLGAWDVLFSVRELFQASLATLTRFEPVKYMAIILNGEVHSAPIIQSALRDRGMISGDFTEERARQLAATLASGRLPAIPVLVSEGPIR